jgi:hypothetical protein
VYSSTSAEIARIAVRMRGVAGALAGIAIFGVPSAREKRVSVLKVAGIAGFPHFPNIARVSGRVCNKRLPQRMSRRRGDVLRHLSQRKSGGALPAKRTAEARHGDGRNAQNR